VAEDDYALFGLDGTVTCPDCDAVLDDAETVGQALDWIDAHQCPGTPGDQSQAVTAKYPHGHVFTYLRVL
jgi:hypothetical protein